MALSTRKKNLIIAEWKAGKYENASQVATAHKIDYKTAQKIIYGISQSNTEIVEAGVSYELMKKSVKNPQEIKAIEKVIQERTIADEIEDIVLAGTLENIRGLKKHIESGKKLTRVRVGDGIQQLEPTTLEAVDYKNAQEAFDKALVTAGKAARHANQNISINNTNATQVNFESDYLSEIQAAVIERNR